LSESSKNFPYYLYKLFCRISPALGETYLRWFSLANFAIVFLIGEFFASIVEGMFPFPWLGKAFASVAEIFWLWIMTVGAFGHWWGFPKIKREVLTHPEEEPLALKEVKKFKPPSILIKLVYIIGGFVMIFMSQWFTSWVALAFAVGGVFLLVVGLGSLSKKTIEKREERRSE